MSELDSLLTPQVLEVCAPFGIDGIVYLAGGDPDTTNNILLALESEPLSPEEVAGIFQEVIERVMLAEG